MARKLQDQVNVVAPSADYPFGRIKNDTGSRDGTPVNEELYGDIHQFFAKLLNAAGLTANGLPDNTTNGFQLFTALQTWVTNQVESGFYTPAITIVSNITSVTANQCRWTRVGKIVTISGSINLTVTSANSDTFIRISLPIESTFPSATNFAGGSGTYQEISNYLPVFISSGFPSPNDNKISIRFECGTDIGNSRVLTFICQYEILP